MKKTICLSALVIAYAFLLCACSKDSGKKDVISDTPSIQNSVSAEPSPDAEELNTDVSDKTALDSEALDSEASTSESTAESEAKFPGTENTDKGNTEKTICNLEKELNDMTNNEYINKYKAGDIIDVTEFTVESVKELFFADEINDDTFARMKGKSFADNCTVERSELRYVRVLHVGFDGATHIGELVVNKAIADSITDIFYRLFLDEYQIEKIILIDEYNADDETSMADNNSSAFNFRYIYNTTTFSNHARGLAIDINPLYNPYVKEASDGSGFIQPYNAGEYVDRSKDNPYYITSDDECCRLFLEHGFTWGGDWTKTKDYQHFEYKLD